MSKDKAESVKVIVRCRPLSKKEVEAGMTRTLEMDTDMGNIRLFNPSAPKEEPKVFTFDTVYDWNSIQKNVYQGTAAPIVESVLDGYNGTVFAYGQTGTGKTFTMEGVRGDPNPALRGIIPLSFEHIFDKITLSSGVEYLVRVSYLEIYNENIRDLLGPDPKAKMDVKEHPDKGVYVKDLSAFVVKGVKEMDQVMAVGNENRTVGFTNMNAQSSRSHSIFTITVESSTPTPDGKATIRAGKLHLVDLAGSERQDKTGATGVRLKEATKINLSLSALGNVISALVDGGSHVPYRDSKLTRLLQDSLGGNSKTVMVANMGPAAYNYDETLSTLRYANRAKNIKNKPKINEDPKDALLRQFQDEIEQLKAEIARRAAGGAPMPVAGSPVPAAANRPRVTDGPAVEQLRQAKEAQMKALLQQKGLAAEEKKRIEAELQASALRAQEEAKAGEELENKLLEMQNKLVGGKQQLINDTEKQQAQLRRHALELEQKALADAELKRRIAEKQESIAAKEEQYTSMQQENEVKTKKLRRLVTKYQEAKTEIRDLQSEWQREKEDMLDSVRDLTSQLKLKMMLIQYFIPKEEAVRVERRSVWDEETKSWKIGAANIDAQQKIKRPISAVNPDGTKRPVSEYARTAKSMGDNPRFKTENIISLELDMPERTTADYNVTPTQRDEEPLFQESSKPRPRTTRPSTASRSSGRDEVVLQDEENFPQARGLVSRRR